MTNGALVPANYFPFVQTEQYPRLLRISRFLLAAALMFGFAEIPAHAGTSITTLFSFADTNGSKPSALLLGADGNLYGTTREGGTNGTDGTIFQLSTNGWTVNTLYSFPIPTNSRPPVQPVGLVQNPNGTFLGTTFAGGAFDQGMIYQLDTNGTMRIVFSFDTTNGGFPESGLLLNTNDGNYYGTTFTGGTNGNNGTIFKLTPAGTFTSLFSFSGTNGAFPYAELALGPDGNMYGTTYFGGANSSDSGTLFRLTTNGIFTNLFSFDGTNSGANPVAGLFLASDGRFYGTTSQGGTNGYGTIFRMDTNGLVATLFAFNGTNGATPLTRLIQHQDGCLYGMTCFGGDCGSNGTIFRFSTNGNFTNLFSFDGTNGANPRNTLIQVPGGAIYGATTGGGSNGSGMIFQFNITPQVPPHSPFLQLSMNGTMVQLNWDSVVNQTYQLQSSSCNGGPQWTNNGPVITATDTNTTITLKPEEAKLFFRLLVAP